MNRKELLVTFVCGLALSTSIRAGAADAPATENIDSKIIAQLETLYGIDKNSAITLLANEMDAAEQAHRIEALNLPNYAGAWFDSDSLSLQVADSNVSEFDAIEHFGATPVLVDHNLKALESARQHIESSVVKAFGRGSVRESYIDVQHNKVVFGIEQQLMPSVSNLISSLPAMVPTQVNAVQSSKSRFFSSDLRGADRTRNSSWPTLPDGTLSPCSVGASAEKVAGSTYTAGFATAGHCGSVTNSFVADDGTTSIGQVKVSSYSYSTGTESNNEDGAWIQTVSPWVPQAQINGYSDGNFNVSGTWAGMLTAPVNTDVCRYGSTSGGPYCGTVSAREPAPQICTTG